MSEFIHIGETVDVRRPDRAPWRGEVLEFVVDGADPAMARVLCTDPPDLPGGFAGIRRGTSTTVPLAYLTRVGDPEGMREDGCDDVDVTGRARPYHRHAVTGEAHAHPSGGLAHTHQTPEQWQAMSQAATGAMGRKVATAAELTHIGEVAAAAARGFTDAAGLTEPAPPDPVEIVALVVRAHKFRDRNVTRSGAPDDADRADAREMLAALLAGPWHLVLIHDAGTARGIVDLEWTP
jgi:hypothetical protein